MKEANNNIPQHWEMKKLGELCFTTSGGTPYRGNSKFYEGNIPWVKSGELDKGLILDTEEKITEDAIKNSSAKIFPKGTLLIALYGATIGKLAFLGIDAATNQAICGIHKSDHIDSVYLYHFLFYKKPSFIKQSFGGAQPNISQAILKDLTVPLPPLPEQVAIVNKIEELFSELENGKEQLLTAQRQLKIYRQSLLKAAFEGRLTSSESSVGTGRDLSLPEQKKSNNINTITENDNLPQGWKLVKIDSLLSDKKKGMTTGPFGTMLKKSDYQKHGVPILGIENIGEGIFQMPNRNFLTKEKAKELKSFTVKENDLIISRSGTIGEICLIPKKMENSVISSNLMKVSLNQEVVYTKFFVYLFLGGKVRQQVFELCKGSSRAFLNQTILNSLDFPLPPLQVQQAIVEILESKLTVCDKLEETISESLRQTETLRQSILKKAFEGKLV
ncbi:MAG: restriction endonuclease subunit S [Leptospiraceae bacterium]|nr:restriction endonuclease subunit S [Leptospiraceae bacterium]